LGPEKPLKSIDFTGSWGGLSLHTPPLPLNTPLIHGSEFFAESGKKGK